MRQRVTWKPRAPSLPDVVGDLAADVALALVIAGAKVVMPGAGARQQRVVDLQLGVAKGDLGFGFAPGPQPLRVMELHPLRHEPETDAVTTAGPATAVRTRSEVMTAMGPTANRGVSDVAV